VSNLTGAAARGGAVTVGVQLVRIVLQFGSIIVLARLLAPDTFGLLAMVLAIIGVAELIRDFGLSIASVQAKVVTREERDNLFWANTGLGLTCALLAWAATPLLVDLYDEERLRPLVLPLALVFVLSGMNTQYRADLARHLRFHALALGDLLGPASGIAAAVVLAWQGAGVWALVAQQLVGAAVSLVVNMVNARWLPGGVHRRTSIRHYFRFGANVLGTQVLSYITRNVDYVVLGAVRGPAELGLYSRAYQMLMVPLNQINAPLTNVAVPVLSRVHDDLPALGRALRRAQLVACYVTAPLLMVAAALAHPIVGLLLGERWLPMADIFAVLAVGGIFRSIGQISYWAFLSTAKTGALLRLQLWTQPVMVLCIVAGVPWGGVGVAVGHLVANLFSWIVSLTAVGRRTGVAVRPLFVTAVTAVLGTALPAGLAAWGASQLVDGDLLRVLVGLVAAALAAGAIGVVARPVRRDAVVMVDTAKQMLRR
jgi:PST family polysaccharide transporter